MTTKLIGDLKIGDRVQLARAKGLATVTHAKPSKIEGFRRIGFKPDEQTKGRARFDDYPADCPVYLAPEGTTP